MVVDMSMPRMTGQEVCREVRRRGVHLPIIMATGYCSPEVMDDLRALDVARILEKPYSVDSLGKAVAEALPPRTSA